MAELRLVNRSVISVREDRISAQFVVIIGDAMPPDNAVQVINENKVQDCNARWVQNWITANEDRSKVCPQKPQPWVYVDWSRKLDGCEDLAALEKEFTARQVEVMDILNRIADSIALEAASTAL